MLGFFLGLFRLVWLFGKGHRAIVLENLALRQQLAIYKRGQQRPGLRWQRERYRRYWANLSKQTAKRGRPSTPREMRELIQTMVRANPLWHSRRVAKARHRSIGANRLAHPANGEPAAIATWKTFLQNHLSEIVAIDFFTVPTIRLRVLFVFTGSGASAQESAALRRDRSSHLRVGWPAGDGSLFRARGPALFDS
jgi:hypothetical protein